MRPWILSELNYAVTKQHHYDVVVLPMGATEPHNLHLPYGTDTYQVEELASRACEAAFQQGERVAMLPPIPYGTETNMLSFPLAINLHPSTLLRVLADIVESLDRQRVRKLVIVNGHGGNDFKPVLRELQDKSVVHLFLCDWFKGLTADVQRQIFASPGDHAGEMETSLGLAFFPHLVARDKQTGALRADDGSIRESRFEALNTGWVGITRPWHLLTTNTGCGNPHAATAEKGQQLMQIMVKRLSAFLVDLARAEVDAEFPY